jgi:fucose 4-O-acetylase-like acetyltransferase
LGNRNQKSKRPFSVTLFALAVLSIAVIHLVRFIQAIQQWEFLASWPGVSPLYLAVTGIVWLGAGLPLAGLHPLRLARSHFDC